jgi:outer membrane protein
VTRTLNECPRIFRGVILAVAGRTLGQACLPRVCQQSTVLLVLAVACLVTVGCTPGGLRGEGQKIEGKIGLIDSSRVWNESGLGKKLKDTLNAHQKNRQALLEADARELQRMQDDLRRVEESRSFQPEGIQRRRQQLQQRYEEYQQKSMELNREIQEKGRDVSESFRVKVDGAVGKVAKRIGLQVVIEKGKGGPTFYSEEGLDVTNQVIEEFDREHP